LLRVGPLLGRKYFELVLRVLLHEDVVLVEDLDRLVHLQYLPGLQVFKVYLPLLDLLAQLLHIVLQFGDLVFLVLLKRTHHFLDPGHFLCQSLGGHASVLDGLLLDCVDLVHLFLDCVLEELLSLGD